MVRKKNCNKSALFEIVSVQGLRVPPVVCTQAP